MKVFLDANILFSASDEQSATRRLLDARVHFGALYGTRVHGVAIVSGIQLADELQRAESEGGRL